jgi:RNA methyltransferase, TrmH family
VTAAIVARWRESAAEPGVVLVDGFHAVKHALRFGAELRLVLTADKAALRALSRTLAVDVTEALEARAVEVAGRTLGELVPRIHPTGVAALAVRPSTEASRKALTAAGRPAPVVVLDQPRNLGNVGAVIRVAAGFGATGVITTGELDPWHPAAIRGSAGLHFATAVERLSAVAVERLSAVAVDRLDLAGLPPGPLYVLDPAGADIRTVAISDDALLAFGSERHGVSPELRAQATELVALPMRPLVSSFNLATSVAMTMFAWMTGRKS